MKRLKNKKPFGARRGYALPIVLAITFSLCAVAMVTLAVVSAYERGAIDDAPLRAAVYLG